MLGFCLGIEQQLHHQNPYSSLSSHSPFVEKKNGSTTWLRAKISTDEDIF
jgi:hypothetical protein